MSQHDRRSLWWGLADQRPHDPVDATDLPGHADVLVVGAGITGMSTAVQLARGGVRVVVVEAYRVGSGTTGHSSAKVTLLQGSQLQQVRQHVDDDTLKAYVEANRAGQGWLLAALRRGGIEPEIRDALTYAVTTQGARAVQAERESSRLAGLPVVDAPHPGLPFTVTDAILLPDQAQIDPLAAVRVLAAELVELGGVIVEGVRVRDVSMRRPWTVDTTAGPITAGHLVLATQASILNRTGHTAGMSAHRSYVLAYQVDEDTRLPMAISLDDNARSLRTATTSRGTFLLVGGGGHAVGIGSAAQHVAELQGWARANLGVGEPSWSWSAQDYRLTTGMPSVGPATGTDGTLLVATGFDKWGLATGAAAGQVLAGHVLGQVPDFAVGLRGHGVHLRQLGETVARVGSTLQHAVGDRAALATPGHAASRTPPAEGEGRLEGNPVAPTAVSTVDGRSCRVSGVCTHLGGILAWNDIEKSWDCPIHGSRFAPDGTLLEGPATTDLSDHD